MPYKDKNCLECESEYSPSSPTQEYCFSCGKERHKEYFKKYNKDYYQKNKESFKGYNKKYQQENKEKIKKQREEYLQRPEVKQKAKEYRQKNKEKYRENSKEYRQRPEVIVRNKKYSQENKERANERARKYSQRPEVKKRINKNKRQRIKNDIAWAIQLRISCVLRQALRNFTKTGKIKKSKDYGIDWEAVIEHLKPFPEDLSKFHIDHIIPLCSFDLTNPEEIKRAFAPENHQWLTAQENMIKGGSMPS